MRKVTTGMISWEDQLGLKYTFLISLVTVLHNGNNNLRLITSRGIYNYIYVCIYTVRDVVIPTSAIGEYFALNQDFVVPSFADQWSLSFKHPTRFELNKINFDGTHAIGS